MSASISSTGCPARPKPPIITVAPSEMPATASSTVWTLLSIIFDLLISLCEALFV
jgi:hypothetical protein